MTIDTQEDYDVAMARMRELMAKEDWTPAEESEARLLVDVIEEYQAKFVPPLCGDGEELIS